MFSPDEGDAARRYSSYRSYRSYRAVAYRSYRSYRASYYSYTRYSGYTYLGYTYRWVVNMQASGTRIAAHLTRQYLKINLW